MPTFVQCERGINNKVMCVMSIFGPLLDALLDSFEQELWVDLVEIPSHWAVL